MSPSVQPSSDINISQTEQGVYYIRNDAVINEIIEHVRQGDYCVVLGPRHSQKQQLLKDVKIELEKLEYDACILWLDLEKFKEVETDFFFPGFAAMISQGIAEQEHKPTATAPNPVLDSPSLRHFLLDQMSMLKKHLVLMIARLEQIEIELLKELLLTLRAIFMEQDENTIHRLVVIATSSLSVAGLTLGENSPFNFAHTLWMDDLSPRESECLINRILAEAELTVLPKAQKWLLNKVGGDRYLIPELCQRYIKAAKKERWTTLNSFHVKRIIKKFTEEEAEDHPPLHETIRVLETEPVNMINVLELLEHHELPRRELMLPLEADVDSLRLTGAVRVKEHNGKKYYLIRNEIYRQFLRRHFQPDRVAYMINRIGQHDEKIDYLKRLAHANLRYRTALLHEVIEAIHDASNEAESYSHLAQHLNNLFAIAKAKVYILTPDNSALKLVSRIGGEHPLEESLSLIEIERPEIRACADLSYRVMKSGLDEPIIFVPLRHRHELLGLAVIHGIKPGPQRRDFAEILNFLKQAGEAIGIVIERKRMEFRRETLHEIESQLYTLEFERLLQATVEGAIKIIPRAQRGLLVLWDNKITKPTAAYHGYSAENINEILLNRDQGYWGIVYEVGKPRRISKVSDAPQVFLKHPPAIQEQKSAVYVPLKIGTQKLGVLCVDNTTTHDAFQDSDVNELSMFAERAASAIQNARLYRENMRRLYELKNLEWVIWMGITYSALHHDLTRMIGGAGLNIAGLRNILQRVPMDIEAASQRINTFEERLRQINALLEQKRQGLDTDEKTLVLRDRVESQAKKLCENQNIELDLTGFDNVTTVRLSPSVFEVVLKVVISNAIRAALDSAEPGIIISNLVTDNWVEIFIINSGAAIPREIADILFTQRVQSGKGLGIGLCIARLGMISLNGEIDLHENQADKVTFRLRLPIQIADNVNNPSIK